MTCSVIRGPATISRVFDIAALDREAWGESDLARFTPDGEHAWRNWADYSWDTAALDDQGNVVAALSSFDMANLNEQFVHKLFVAPHTDSLVSGNYSWPSSAPMQTSTG